jgi:hypothetical protein
MSGMDGTGPRGMGSMAGRGFGRCRFGPVQPEAAPSPAQVSEGAVTPGEKTDHLPIQAPQYGAGRGGIPCGCGKGRVFAGGRRCH